ncbi:MAG: hypothetical protein AB7U82_10730 [Blastocatellales bacterium]
MPEDETNGLNADTNGSAPFEDFVRQQLEMIIATLERMERDNVDRFVQLSRQVRELDQKVDIFIKEQIYIKDDIRELRALRLQKN